MMISDMVVVDASGNNLMHPLPYLEAFANYQFPEAEARDRAVSRTWSPLRTAA
jgi:hypothetical protein